MNKAYKSLNDLPAMLTVAHRQQDPRPQGSAGELDQRQARLQRAGQLS